MDVESRNLYLKYYFGWYEKGTGLDTLPSKASRSCSYVWDASWYLSTVVSSEFHSRDPFSVHRCEQEKPWCEWVVRLRRWSVPVIGILFHIVTSRRTFFIYYTVSSSLLYDKLRWLKFVSRLPHVTEFYITYGLRFFGCWMRMYLGGTESNTWKTASIFWRCILFCL